MFLHPTKITVEMPETLDKINGWNPRSWRFGSDDFPFLGGGFKCSSLFEEMFDEHIFQMGLKPPASFQSEDF